MSLFDRDNPSHVDLFERARTRTRLYNSETWAIVQAMKATGNQPGVIEQWKAGVQEWALRNANDKNALAVHAWLPHWQVRPFYTVYELAPIWPALAIAIGFTTQWPAVLKSPQRLMHELDYAGLPHFVVDGRRYYIVEQIHLWKNATQQERENALTHG